MENRPTLDKNISLIDFKEFYWLKADLTEFCKKVGINTNAGKIELADRIAQYLSTGQIPLKPTNKKIVKSNFDWNSEVLKGKTLITDNYKNTENVRAFFIKEIGSTFSFNVNFMNWMKNNEGKSLNDAIQEWKQLKHLKKDTNYKTEIKPQFEYNRYIRDFLKDNSNLSSKDAIKFWNLKRVKRGTNEYEQTDLQLQ